MYRHIAKGEGGCENSNRAAACSGTEKKINQKINYD